MTIPQKPSVPIKPSVLTDALVGLASRLSELKEDHYRQLVVLDSLVELLIEKGVLSAEELRLKARTSEIALELEIGARTASSSATP
ncbi:hypothetical protein [Cohnella fermenti]|uniref:Nitrile hydratase subunit beta n=1 Tax=Cohnella fermenti TaxID=2565925 RepID=A0A4S4BHV4_9BACL|nr:hypothetical protein [Cohnella fermenti]THF74167.1 hypothetical protein E6C55_26450 [Cohnella fermenti]